MTTERSTRQALGPAELTAPEVAEVDASIRALLAEQARDPRNRATSLRLNQSLWSAANLAVEHGLAPSLTALVEDGLAERLAALAAAAVEQAALDAHYAAHPHLRAEPWELALAAARLDGSPLVDHPHLLRQAATELGDHADVDGILHWAAGALATTPR